MEFRDRTLTKLKENIEKLFYNSGEKVVVVAHGIGNRLFHYFLTVSLGEKKAQQWTDQFISSWFALSAPWLGSPCIFKGLISNVDTYHFGLESIISREDISSIIKQTPSTLCYLPPSQPNTNRNSTDLTNQAETSLAYADFLYFGDESDSPKSINTSTFLEKYLPHVHQHYTDPYFTSSQYLSPPPIASLHSIYGTNSPTEMAIFFSKLKMTKTGKDIFPLDIIPSQNIEIKKGIAYEGSQTPQKILEMTLGIKTKCSGDGTVPYVSLFYPIFWQKYIKEVNFTEIESISHTDILQSLDFFVLLINSICKCRPHLTYSFVQKEK